jgi:hypothetical protein
MHLLGTEVGAQAVKTLKRQGQESDRLRGKN